MAGSGAATALLSIDEVMRADCADASASCADAVLSVCPLGTAL